MTKIHSQDEPLRPDPNKTAHTGDSDQTFSLSPNDPARVENRGDLEATIGDDDDIDTNDDDTRAEYPSG